MREARAIVGDAKLTIAGSPFDRWLHFASEHANEIDPLADSAPTSREPSRRDRWLVLLFFVGMAKTTQKPTPLAIVVVASTVVATFAVVSAAVHTAGKQQRTVAIAGRWATSETSAAPSASRLCECSVPKASKS